MDATAKSSRHAPSCRPLFKICMDSTWGAIRYLEQSRRLLLSFPRFATFVAFGAFDPFFVLGQCDDFV